MRPLQGGHIAGYALALMGRSYWDLVREVRWRRSLFVEAELAVGRGCVPISRTNRHD